MPELYNGAEYDLCRRALDRTPIHFMGIAYKAELKAVYELGGGSYHLAIAYGPYALHAIVNVNDAALGLYFDYASMMVAVHCTVEQTMMLYENKHSPFYQAKERRKNEPI